jgi:electron transport complex protein RnfE
MSGLKQIFNNGVIRENPLLMLLIGLCPAVAVTTSVENGLGMGLSMTFVLTASEATISILKRTIPDSIRIPIFLVVVATFTTVVDYMLQAYFPGLSTSLGIFIPIIAVNCINLGRIEAFAYKRPLGESLADALGMGVGVTWVLVGISAVRELFGGGSILGFGIIPSDYSITFFSMPAGGFFVFAFFISLNIFIKSRLKEPVEEE